MVNVHRELLRAQQIVQQDFGSPVPRIADTYARLVEPGAGRWAMTLAECDEVIAAMTEQAGRKAGA